MKIFKKGLCLVLAMLILVMGMPFGALATTDGTGSSTSTGVTGQSVSASETGPVILQLDTPETAVIFEGGERVNYYFTPETDGWYKFYSTGDHDTCVTMYDMDFNQIAYNDDYMDSYNFALVKKLDAGVTYIFAVGILGYDTGEFEVILSKTEAKIAESIVFEDVTIIEGESRTTENYWYEDQSDYVEYELYNITPMYTVYYSDGSSQQFSSRWFSDDTQEYYINIGHNQTPDYSWGIGAYTATAEVHDLDIKSSFTVNIVKSPVVNVEVAPQKYLKGSHGSYTWDNYYDEELNEWVNSPEYFYYNLWDSEFVTVYLEDGTVLNSQNGFNWNGEECSFTYVSNADDQSYNNQWDIGIHTQTRKILGYTFDYTVEIVNSPVADVTYDPVNIIEYTEGYYQRDSLDYDEETGENIWSPEYYFYQYSAFTPENMVITLTDESVIEGTGFEWNGNWYELELDRPVQDYENQLIVGNTYEMKASIAGYDFTIDANIVKSPVVRVDVKSEKYIKNYDGYYTYGEYYDEDLGEWVELPEYFRYYALDSEDFTIYMEDGSVLTYEDGFYWNDQYIDIECLTNDDEQSYENQWDIGTHTFTYRVLGYTFDVEVEIIKSPVVSVTYDPIEITEYTNGEFCTDQLGDEGSGIYGPEYFHYYIQDLDRQNIVITLVDGSEYTVGTDNFGFEWNDEYYPIIYESIEQSYENQLTAGNTYKMPASVAGYDFDFEVKIKETSVASVNLDSMDIIVHTNGYYATDPYYDHELDSWVESPEYYRYHQPDIENVEIILKDGTVIKENWRKWAEENGGFWVSDPLQDYDNQWTVGNTYTGKFWVGGYVGTFDINIVESPVASVTCDPINIFEYSHGEYTRDWYYDEFGEHCSPEYYYYYPYLKNLVIKLKNGSEITDSDGIWWNDEWFNLYHDSDQSYENQWTVGNTYQAMGSIAGYEFYYDVNIVESPVASITLNNLRFPEFTHGYYSSDSYWDDELQQEVTTPEYFRYDYSWPDNPVITLKDGTKFNSYSFEYNGETYSASMQYPVQNYENQWTVGNTYVGTITVLGYSVNFNIDIVEMTIDDCYEYVVTDEGVIITNCFITSETLEIPETINGLPVISVAELCWTDQIRHIIFPDSVTHIGDGVLEGLWNLETVTFGSGITNLSPYMFNYCQNLSNIIVSEDNDNFATVDGVLYNKDVDTFIAYPVMKGDKFEVPVTVTNIDALNSWIYADLELSFPEGHPLYVTVDGVTYNKEMTKVIFCSPSKEGSYVMPDTVTEIAEGAFQNCNDLTEVKISENVTEIVYCAFYSCASLSKVDLPSGLVSIGDLAFQFNESLESIELPNTLETIGSNSFSYSGLTALSVPGSVKTIGESAFECAQIEELSLGNGVAEIFDYAFAWNPISAVTLPDSLTYLGKYVFCDCENLKTVSIGSGLQQIGDGAFYATGLESVTVPGTVKVIGEYAFGSCELLASVTLNEGISKILDCAFSNCNSLEGINIPESVIHIDSTVFNACDSLSGLTVAKGNTKYHSAGNCIIDTSNKVLNNGCSASVIPTDGSVTSIADCAFNYIHNLTSIKIPNTVVSIGDNAFMASGLSEITIPDSVESIGDTAFALCENLDEVVIGNGVKEMGLGVFAQCPITSADLGNSVPYVSEFAFVYTDIESILLPNSVTDIMYGAFGGCFELTSIEIPLSVESIDVNAFADCYSLSDVYYQGSEEDKENIKIAEEGNETLLKATWHYNWTNPKWDIREPVYAMITEQPVDALVLNGETASVKVSAVGDELTYKWYFKNKGSTSYELSTTCTGDTYTAVMNEARAGRQVYCVVTDKYGTSVQSNVVTLNMKTVAAITKQPENVFAFNGESVMVTVNATGDSITYKWFFKNKGEAEFTESTLGSVNSYTTTMDATRNGREVYCVVTDKYGNTVQSDIVTLTMKIVAAITKQPVDVLVLGGDTANVTVNAVGDGLTYKWYYMNKGATQFTESTVCTGDTYTAEMDSARDGRQVYCVVTDKYGNSVKSETVTLSMKTEAAITKQPEDALVLRGDTVNITVNAVGDGLTYKWYYKNLGATEFTLSAAYTGNIYTVDNMDAARNGRQLYCVVTDKYGNTVQSVTITLTMKVVAAITKQPEDALVLSGDTANVTVNAEGDDITYTWYYKNKDEVKFNMSTVFNGNTYYATMDSATNGCQVYCVVTDKYGNTVQSETVTLTMKVVAAITKQPEDILALRGDTVNITVNAVGDGLTYKWYYMNKGATEFTLSTAYTGNTYTVDNMDDARNGRQLYCVVTDKYGNTVQSETVTLTMKVVAAITKQPVDVTVLSGDTAKVTISAIGDGITYKWFYKDVNDEAFTLAADITGNAYSAVMNADIAGRQVYCVVTDKYNNLVESALVTLDMMTKVTITKQPESVTVLNGEVATVTVEAQGEGLKYEWYFKNKGETAYSYSTTCTGNSYSLPMNSLRDGRSVYCIVFDKYDNFVKSEVVTINMKVTVKITKQPTSVTVANGAMATVTVTATGEGLTYKWFFKNKGSTTYELSSTCTGNSYSLEMNSLRDGRSVYCIVTDKDGNSVMSEEATMNMVKSTIKITKQPANVTVANGAMATVTVTATGEGLTYAWYYKNKGETAYYLSTTCTGSSYALEMNSLRDGRSVYCVISDKYGNSVRSEEATMNMAKSTIKITKQPANVTVANGAMATVTVTATGEGLTYKWYFKNKGETNYALSTTCTGISYALEMNSLRDGRSVYCVISDKYGNSVRSEVATMNMAKSTIKITKQPANVTVANGAMATVTVTATGEGLTYKWYFKNKGETAYSYSTTCTGSSYALEMNSLRDGRSVYCVISDKNGNSIRTEEATMNMVKSTIKITKQPTSVTVANGAMATVTVTATGEGLTYKWYFKNKGETAYSYSTPCTGSSYALEMNSLRDGRSVYCVISDKNGNSVRTEVATINMTKSTIKITKQPTSVTVANGAMATVTVTATGEGLTYAWYYKNKGETAYYLSTTCTGNSYSLAMNSLRNGRSVYCIVTDKNGNAVKTQVATINMK